MANSHVMATYDDGNDGYDGNDVDSCYINMIVIGE